MPSTSPLGSDACECPGWAEGVGGHPDGGSEWLGPPRGPVVRKAPAWGFSSTSGWQCSQLPPAARGPSCCLASMLHATGAVSWVPVPFFSSQSSDTRELGSEGQEQDPGVWLGLRLPWELGYQICHSAPSPRLGVPAQKGQGRAGMGGPERLLKERPLVSLTAPPRGQESSNFPHHRPMESWAGGGTCHSHGCAGSSKLSAVSSDLTTVTTKIR